MTIQPYDSSYYEKWDAFVEESLNGNFLQSRRFLSYHPESRFNDCSLLYFDGKGNLRAVIPAAERIDEGKKVFVSHPGSTYGGIVFGKKICSAKHLQTVIDELESYLKEQGFDAVDLRFPPDFMWQQDASLVEYLMAFNGYTENIELTTYVDLLSYKENTLSNFSQGKRTNVNNCIKQGLEFKTLSLREHAEALHTLLTENLKKFGASPVHTVDELWDLYSDKLSGETEIVGVFDQEKVLAAGWIFIFKNMNVMHTQYLCADNEYAKLSPMTFLYYSSIEYCKQKGFRYLSWGISTEDHGKVLNWGLTESKESFDSLHGVHRSYKKTL